MSDHSSLDNLHLFNALLTAKFTMICKAIEFSAKSVPGMRHACEGVSLALESGNSSLPMK
jgi:hypothetical protein